MVLLINNKKITPFSNLTVLVHESAYTQEVDKFVELYFIKISFIKSCTRLDLVQQPQFVNSGKKNWFHIILANVFLFFFVGKIVYVFMYVLNKSRMQ